MSCPDIYIAPSYWVTPHTPEYGNTAIDVGAAGTVFVAGVNRTIQVTVRNHGTDDSPQSRLELYWSDPVTSFSLIGQIDVSKFGVVPGGDGLGTDGTWTENFSWTPSTSTVWPNGGHVCLLAQTQNEASPTGAGCMAQGHTPSSSAATDARSAIRNIHVSSAMTRMSRIAGGHERGMNFAFIAADAGGYAGETRVHVRPLDPDKDRAKLEVLAADPAVHKELACRQGKFALPEDVLIAEGTERVVLPRPRVVVRKGSDALRRMPRIGNLGTLDNAVAARLLPHGARLMPAAKAPLALNLVPGEMRQTIVQAVPRQADALYAVEVEHVGPKDQAIGGLVIIFVPPPDRF
jgi:hypothetical protein